ncbi:MAG: subfamily polymerase sigma-24 factor [Micavibrio sp.]|nr:subfamily polymerase sigma-24 factor [Micavibrio sp.]
MTSTQHNQVVNYGMLHAAKGVKNIQEEILENRTALKLFALKLTGGNHAEADDLLQETVLRALEKEHLFEPGTSFFKWGCKIMFNLFATEYRRKVRFDTKYDPDVYISQRSVEPGQESAADWNNVQKKLAQLPKHHRDIITTICIHGSSYEEAAEKLKIELGTVRSRLSRARDNLTRLS